MVCGSGHGKRKALATTEGHKGGDRARVDVFDPEYAVVTDRSGSRRYRQSFLRKMLVKIWNFTEAQAASMCLGFGMDPQPRPKQRTKSCACSGAMGDPNHKFPSGFTFAVTEKYEDFR